MDLPVHFVVLKGFVEAQVKLHFLNGVDAVVNLVFGLVNNTEPSLSNDANGFKLAAEPSIFQVAIDGRLVMHQDVKVVYS